MLAVDQLDPRIGEGGPCIGGDRREARIDLDECVEDHGRGGEPGEGLVVGGDHVPRSPGRARIGEHVRERGLVGVPVPALLDVGGAELPVALRIVDPGEQPVALLVAADVQEDLDDPVALLGQVVLPVVDLAVAPFPDAAVLELRRDLLAIEDLGMDADDQHLLVVGAVEDPDVTALRQPLLVAPEVIVVEILARGNLEAVDLDALRVDAAHHVLDRAVLAGGVHCLEADEHAIVVLRREPRLVLGEELDALLEDRTRFGLADAAGRRAGVEVAREPDLAARLHAELVDEAADSPRSDLGHRCFPCTAQAAAGAGAATAGAAVAARRRTMNLRTSSITSMVEAPAMHTAHCSTVRSTVSSTRWSGPNDVARKIVSTDRPAIRRRTGFSTSSLLNSVREAFAVSSA